jgi:hypothetical protein
MGVKNLIYFYLFAVVCLSAFVNGTVVNVNPGEDFLTINSQLHSGDSLVFSPGTCILVLILILRSEDIKK